MSTNDLSSFAAVMFALRAIVAMLNEHRLPSAYTMGTLVTSFGEGHVYGRTQAGRGIVNYLAKRTAPDAFDKATAGEVALLTLAAELVKVGMMFEVVAEHVGPVHAAVLTGRTSTFTVKYPTRASDYLR